MHDYARRWWGEWKRFLVLGMRLVLAARVGRFVLVVVVMEGGSTGDRFRDVAMSEFFRRWEHVC